MLSSPLDPDRGSSMPLPAIVRHSTMPEGKKGEDSTPYMGFSQFYECQKSKSQVNCRQSSTVKRREKSARREARRELLRPRQSRDIMRPCAPRTPMANHIVPSPCRLCRMVVYIRARDRYLRAPQPASSDDGIRTDREAQRSVICLFVHSHILTISSFMSYINVQGIKHRKPNKSQGWRGRRQSPRPLCRTPITRWCPLKKRKATIGQWGQGRPKRISKK